MRADQPVVCAASLIVSPSTRHNVTTTVSRFGARRPCARGSDYDIRPERLRLTNHTADTKAIISVEGEARVGARGSHSSRTRIIDRSRGACAIAFAAALLGGPIFGVAGASGRG